MYIKRFLLLLVVYYSNVAFADVIIFNKSSRYDMEVTYNICSGDSPMYNFTCTPEKLIKIKHATRNQDGYVSIAALPITTDIQFLNMISATQKDDSGQVIAQTNYSFDEINSDCGSNLITSFIDNDGTNTNKKKFAVNKAIILEDYPQLPIITCNSLPYKIEKIN